jgi:hypothetical protein
MDSGRVEGWAAVVVPDSSRADKSHCWDHMMGTSLDADIAEVACLVGTHSPCRDCRPCAVAAYSVAEAPTRDCSYHPDCKASLVASLAEIVSSC